jgi:ribokinase
MPMGRPQLVSVGSINVDLQVRVERCPAAGEALVGEDFLLVGGGKGANVAYFARRLGAESLLIGRVGSDLLSEAALRVLEDLGVDLRHVGRARDVPTGIAMITVYPDHNKGIVLASNANGAWDSAALEAAEAAVASAPAGSVLVADLELDPEVVIRTAAAARGRGFPVILDPSPAGRVTNGLLALVGYLTPNPAEAKLLTGIEIDGAENAFRAAEALVERGARTALVKLGAGGCVVVGAESHFQVAPITVRAVDTTGAGDAFAGALGVALLEGQPLAQAASLAVSAASFSVTRYGAQPSYPSREELEAFVARFQP